MAQIVWSRRALRDLNEIALYVGQFNPLAAQRLSIRLRAAADGLSMFPDRGRLISDGRRDLALIRPYVIRYRHAGAVVTILRIRHGARRPA